MEIYFAIISVVLLIMCVYYKNKLSRTRKMFDETFKTLVLTSINTLGKSLHKHKVPKEEIDATIVEFIHESGGEIIDGDNIKKNPQAK